MIKVTSKDVAKLANVSQSTVSFILNNRTDISITEATRLRVLEAAKELNYGPFSKIKEPFATSIIAVFIPTFDNPYYSSVLKILNCELQKINIKIMIFCTDKSEQVEIKALIDADNSSIDAIIYLYTPIAKNKITEIAEHKKIYVLGEIDYPLNANVITLNSRRAGYIVAQHLYELGHRNIAFISNPINQISLSRKHRLEGIQLFAKEKNIENYLVTHILTTEEQSINELETGYVVTQELLKKQKNITAFIGVNDYTAIGILNALSDARISVPNEISVVGFDNISLTSVFQPNLTTIDHLIKERVLHTIFLLTSKTSGAHITYDPKLIIRNSTAKARETDLF